MNASEVPVLRPPREFSGATRPEFDRCVAPHLENNTVGLVVDLTTVSFVTSTGLGCLVGLGRTLGQRGASVALAGGCRPIVKLIRTVGLDQVMPHFRTVEEAADYVLAQRTAGT